MATFACAGQLNEGIGEGGGPAFPLAVAEHIGFTGMSLRDWFAGQALMGTLASWPCDRGVLQARNAGDDDARRRLAAFAELAYKHADAMLAQREKSAQ